MDEVQVPVEVTPEVNIETAPVELESKAEPVKTEAVETPPPVQEKMVPSSQVSKIASREAKKAAEKARQETIAEYERQRLTQDTAPVTPAPTMGGMPQLTPEQFQEQLMQAAQRMSAQMTAKQMASDFESKIQSEIQDDPDFGELYDSLNIEAHPELVIWMNGMDNSAKVVKDLAQNPAKFANILMLAKSGMGALAKRELTKLSESIKTNMTAQAQPKVKEPLDQLSPTNLGVGSGEMSVSDFQKQSWLRG